MIGFWIVEKFIGSDDAAGCKTQIRASNKMDMNIKSDLYLPPYMRKSQSDISVGDTVFAIVDDTTGLGAALFGVGSADFGYFFDADVKIKKSLDVDGDISTDSDVIAKEIGGDITMRTHWHGYIDTTPGGPVVSQTQAANTVAPTPGV